MDNRPFDLDQAVILLKRTPSVIRALLEPIPQDLVHQNEGPDTFSPFDVVGHLIDGEETDWVVRARIILESGEQRPFEPYDRFRHYERNRRKSIHELLDEFERLRAHNLEVIRSWELEPPDFLRRGRHPEFGSVTLGQLLSSWVVHDHGHIVQVARVIAKQYARQVGPWQAYLTVLGEEEP